MIFLFSLISIAFSKIPEEYGDLIAEAKVMAREKKKLRILSNDLEKEVYYPGSYSINHYHFELSSAITGDGAKGLYGYAVDEAKKVAAIISDKKTNSTDINTQRGTVLSLPTLSTLVKIDEKIAEDGDATIVSYYEIEPFSIFSKFEFSNLNAEFPLFSKIYNPLKSYLGNDIFNEFNLNGYCGSDNDDDSIKQCKGFVTYNWPNITKGDDISQQEAKEHIVQILDTNGNNKEFKTNIGGVFGIFAGVQIKFTSIQNIKLSFFIGCESDVQIKMFMPEGEYNNFNFDIGNAKQDLINFPLVIFDTMYSIDITAIAKLGIKDLSFKINKNLSFNYRAGFKTQGELRLISTGKQDNPEKPSSFKPFLVKEMPPENDFKSDKFEFDLSVYGGLEVVINSSKGANTTEFAVNGGVEYRRYMNMVHNPDICPCPYLLGRHINKIYTPLETTVPFTYKNFTLIPAKKYFGQYPLRVSPRSDPYCFGGNYHVFDQNNDAKNSAALIIRTAKYSTENKDKSNTRVSMSVLYYPKSLDDKRKPKDLEPITFTKKNIQDGTELKLDYFVYLNDYSKSSLLTLQCNEIGAKNNLFIDKSSPHLIGGGMDENVEFEGTKGSKIVAKVEIEPIVSCDIDTEIPLDVFTKWASVSPDLRLGNSIGLIYYNQETGYETPFIKIHDEFSNENFEDCIYPMKNVWKVNISSLYIKDNDYKKITISFDKIENQVTKQIFYTEVNSSSKDELKNKLITFDISSPDVVIKMNINIEKPFYKFNIKQNDIQIKQNFFDFNENTIKIESKDKDKWNCDLIFTPYNYPVIFNVESIRQDSSVIFAPAFKLNKPFKMDIIGNSPSTESVECHLSAKNKYGIFKIEFEIDMQSYEDINLPINALLIMKKLRPLCESNQIGEDSFIIQIPKNSIITYQKDGKTVASYPIPLRREPDDPDEEDDNIISPSIRLVDIYFSPSVNENTCGRIQMFSNTYSFIHSACILVINEETQSYDYTFSSSEKDVRINHYSYPPNSNLDVEWKLYGVLIDHDNKTKNHKVVLWQQEVVFPVNSHIDIMPNDITQYFSNDNEKYSITCPRCSSIRYHKRSVPDEKGSILPDKNKKFVFNVERNRETVFYAFCKDKDQTHCETILDNLNPNILTLISVPLISSIEESEVDYDDDFNYDYTLLESFDMQFTYNRDKIAYFSDTKSKISVLHEFNNKLTINIKAKAKGKFIHIFASSDGVNIPFFRQFNRKKDDNFNELSIKSNDGNEVGYLLLGGSLYLFDNPSLGSISSIDISSAPNLFGIDSKLVESISVNYNEIGDHQNFDGEHFCFSQSDEALCQDPKYFPLRYPDFNHLRFFVNSESKNYIEIIVENDLTNFYPVFYDLAPRDITFKCTKNIKISGEFTVPSGLKVGFIGPFDLNDLHITLDVDWVEDKTGIVAFFENAKISSINLNIIRDPNEYDNNYENEKVVVEAGSPSLNLLTSSKFISSFEHFEYSTTENSVKCIYRSLIFPEQNDFRIYNTKRSLCSKYNGMDSIKVSDLNDFQNYFHGSYGNPIILHIVEDMISTEKTLESFF